MFLTSFNDHPYILKETSNTFCIVTQFYCVPTSPTLIIVLLSSFMYVFLLSIMFLYCNYVQFSMLLAEVPDEVRENSILNS